MAPSEPSATLPFVSPATGERFGEVLMTSPAQVQAAVDEMRAAAGPWGQRSVAERVRALRQFQAVLIDARDEISAIISRDHGKNRQDSLIEVFVTVDGLSTSLDYAHRWLRRERVPNGLYIFKRFYVEPRPYGVAAVIAPWNYPFLLAMQPMLAALVAGNTVVLKPSEVTGAVGVLIERLVQRVPEVAGLVRVVHGGGRVGAALVQARPDFIFLTGSTATGKKVMAAAAEHVIPVVCELGGKDPMLVLDDADVDAAAEWGAWGAFFNAGQTCMAVERVYALPSVYDQFVEKAVAHARRLQTGYSLDPDARYNLGPVSSPAQMAIVEAHVADAVARGARVLTGGQRMGMFYEPTVLVDVTHHMAVMREETFGPILPIMKARDEADAVRLANDSAFGLSASVWSRDLDHAQAVARHLECGSVIINDTIAHFGVPTLPFGGVKQSGFGRAHGREGVLQFTQARAYATGQPPHPLDIATILRKPGHYDLGAAILRLAFGVTPRQRLEPVREAAASQLHRLRMNPTRLGLGALGAAAAAVGVAVALGARRGKK
jgi:acyl-CoA reductase-like NAD-dependent aldehyde dehydrogenase